MSIRPTKEVYLSALGIACTLGRGKQEIAEPCLKQRASATYPNLVLLCQRNCAGRKNPF